MSEMLQPGSPEIDKLSNQLQTLGANAGGAAPLPGFDVSTLIGGMSMTVIVVNILAGLVGTGYFMYGKKVSGIPYMVSGIFLCIFPYFIKNDIGLISLCLTLIAAPPVIKKYYDI